MARRGRSTGGKGKKRGGRSAGGARGRERARREVRRHEFRRRLLLVALVLVVPALVARSFQLSVVQHGSWLTRAKDQQADSVPAGAARGTIYDRDGVPLAASREVYILSVAPHEITDPDQAIERLTKNAGLSLREARRIVTSERKWWPLTGRYEESVRAALDGTAGFYLQPTFLRFYPHERLASEVLGRVNMSDEVAGGIEQELDSLLSGHDGWGKARVDNLGRHIPGMMLQVVDPEPGLDVVLTLDAELQEIASDALRDALQQTSATSGEMLIADPYTGDILAAVSRRRDGHARVWTAATSPYEPGSTIKPFTVGSLLTEGVAALTDSIYAEQGSYRLHGRTIIDVHGYGWLTLREGFLYSSNIVMAKATSRLSSAQQYQRLRDLGFGMRTGVTYPSESDGVLRKPGRWSKQSQASLSFGYELMVTPLQLVMAYAAIANGGILMEPRLVREVRARNGRVLQTFEPRSVRRAMQQSVAETLRKLLEEAVETGTGQNASMGDWKVAGKTGTAQLSANGRYLEGEYVATFAGFFPAESPQLVFLVKLDRPRGDYYGGQTAAPVTRATLEAALAANGTPLDRSAVATVTPGLRGPVDPVRPVSFAAVSAVSVSLDLRRPAPVIGPADEDRADEGEADEDRVLVPDVVGLGLREAARQMHEAGFEVRIDGSGAVRSTRPRAGVRAVPGETVRIVAGVGR